MKDILQSTPTDKKVPENLAQSFETSCNEDMDNFYVNADDIRNIIVKLNKNKGDGGIGYNSNHLIFGSQSLFQHIGNLIELMVSHGYTPSLMSQSHIVSIPKDKRGNLQSSDNYRGISLSNALCKVVDLWVLSKCSHLLLSSDMQYAFKINHSTVMCTTMVKEIISYYNSNHSDVYACLVDASKAYDKLNFGKLFQILIDRGIPNLIIRLLFQSYTHQQIHAKWGSSVSDSFTAQNGVKQGSILSTVLFNIYMDTLLYKLKDLGNGCHIGHKFYGALAYADDLVLLSPSVKALQEMINLCEIFGTEYSLQFTERKTECIRFGENIKANPPIYMSGSKLQWKTQVKHLGNMISSDQNDASDIAYKRGIFYGNINKLLANLGSLPSSTLNVLFQSYCSSFYGSQLWDLSSKYINDIYISWQKGMRRIWKLPYQTHRYLLPYLSPSNLHVETHFIFRFLKLYESMLHNTNSDVSFIAHHVTFHNYGTLGHNYIYMKYLYDIDINGMSYADSVKHIKSVVKVNLIDKAFAGVVMECCNMRD